MALRKIDKDQAGILGKIYYFCKQNEHRARARKMNTNRILLTTILLLTVLPVLAQNDVARRSRKPALRQRVQTADSLRMAMRQAAAEGRLLQWGDSMLATRLNSGQISRKQYKRYRNRIISYGRTLHKGDSLLAGRYDRITYDTLYIHRPAGRWTVKFRENMSGSTLETSGKRDGTPFRAHVQSDYRATLSAAISYRGISLGVAVNPAKLAGRNKDNEFNLTSYGNKFGFDVTLLTSKTYRGHVSLGSTRVPVSKGMVSQQALNANLYYAFNGRRFSIPAAFSQSYLQKRSAGSVLVGMSFDGQDTDIQAIEGIGMGRIKLKIVDLGIGAGYGYNFVAGRRWLFHLSALPTFSMVVHSHIDNDNERVNLHYKFPSAIITGRGAAVYSWKNNFLGASMVFNYSGIGDTDRLHIERTKFRLRAFYGFRL